MQRIGKGESLSSLTEEDDSVCWEFRHGIQEDSMFLEVEISF